MKRETLVPERSKGSDSRSDGTTFVGSNPTQCKKKFNLFIIYRTAADVFVTPGADVFVTPGADVFVTPGADVFVTPAADVFVTPAADVFVTPGADVRGGIVTIFFFLRTHPGGHLLLAPSRVTFIKTKAAKNRAARIKPILNNVDEPLRFLIL